jgi:hypothetical protein
MATDWYMEGPWIKNCNCDPGCPCDFNANPTHGNCQGIVAMKIEKGHFGDVDLSGLAWGGVASWPGALHEGNGELQPFIDSSASEEQVNAIAQALSGEHGDTLFQIIVAICPTVHDPIIAPIQFDFDIDERTAHLKVGDGVVETVSETMRGIDPPDPYRVLVTIPNGFEYTGPDESAETAKATKTISNGAIKLDLADSHSSLAWVRHGSSVQTGAHPVGA